MPSKEFRARRGRLSGHKAACDILWPTPAASRRYGDLPAGVLIGEALLAKYKGAALAWFVV